MFDRGLETGVIDDSGVPVVAPEMAPVGRAKRAIWLIDRSTVKVSTEV